MGRRKHAEKQLLENPLASADARAARIKRIRNMANLSRQELCEKSGININSLKGWEIGRYGGLTGFGAEKIITAVTKEGVQCTFEWLMYGIGAGPSVLTGFDNITITQNANSLKEDITNHDEDKKIADELTLFKKQYIETLDFIVEDEGMSPFYQPGEYVAGLILSDENIHKAIGQSCIVQLENGIILLRQLRNGSDHNHYTLISLNINQIAEPVIYNVKITKAAPVIFHRKRNIFT